MAWAVSFKPRLLFSGIHRRRGGAERTQWRRENPQSGRLISNSLFLCRTGQRVLVYADDVNILGDDTDTIKKKTQTLIDASKEIGLEVNIEQTKCMLLSRHQNAGQNHNVKMGNMFGKCGTVQIFGNDSNKSKPDSGGN
jgi:hypothetical protein